MKWQLPNEFPFIKSTLPPDWLTNCRVCSGFWVFVCLCPFLLSALLAWLTKTWTFYLKLIWLVYVRACVCMHECTYFDICYSVAGCTCTAVSKRHFFLIPRQVSNICVCLGRCVQRKQEFNFKSRFNTNKNDIFLLSSWHFITVISLTWGPLERESRQWPKRNKQCRLRILWVRNKAYLIGILCIVWQWVFPEAVSDTSINIFLFLQFRIISVPGVFVSNYFCHFSF